MRFLFFTDLHFTNCTPENRRGNFAEDLLEKLRRVYSLAKERECDKVLFGGDLFDRTGFYDVDLLCRLQELLDGSGLETLAILGQHDLKGYNRDSITKASVRVFRKMCKSFEILEEPWKSEEIRIYPSHCFDNPREEAKKGEKNCFNLMMTHHLLFDKKKFFETIDISTIETGMDCILSGDLHCGFDPVLEGECWFANPGSLGRKSIDEANRKVFCLILDCGLQRGKKICKIEKVEIPAKIGEEAFFEALAEIEVSHISEEKVSYLADLLMCQKEGLSLEEVLRQAGKKMGIQQKVLDLIAEFQAGIKQ